MSVLEPAYKDILLEGEIPEVRPKDQEKKLKHQKDFGCPNY